MKKKISLLLCAGLLLSMLTGCSGGKLDLTWFTSKFTGKTAEDIQQEQEAAAAEHDGEMLRVERSALIQRHRTQRIHEPGRDALMRDPRFLILHQRADHRAPVKDPHAVSFLDDERVGRRL